MKALFVLLLIVSSANSAPQKSTYRTRLVDFMNVFREEMAIAMDIPNMQEVSYDEELEKEGKTFNTCDDVIHGANYRVKLIDRIEFFSKMEIPSGVDMIEMFTNKELLRHFSEFIHPLNSKIACVVLKSKCPDPMGHLQKKPEAEAVCLFGMKNTDPLRKLQTGPPGSKCPNGRAESGLCKAAKE